MLNAALVKPGLCGGSEAPSHVHVYSLKLSLIRTQLEGQWGIL